MPYALRYRDNNTHAGCTLVELTRAQVKQMGNADTFRDGVWCYQYCSARRAHAWVRDDGIHETRLWIDADNRIRV